MKKKILIIIAIIMIISTIIRTVIVGVTFFNFSDKIIQNQSLLVAEIIKHTENKEKFLKIIKNFYHIKDIKFVEKKRECIKYNLTDKTIISYISLEDKSIEITYYADDYIKTILIAILQLIAIAFISLIVIILIVNYFLTPYLELLEKVKISTEKILKGDFDYKLQTKLKGEAKDFVDSYNYFLDQLKNSFGVIEDKYKTLIDTKETSDNPLKDASDVIDQLANIFKFKKIIEGDSYTELILDRLEDILKNFNIKNFVIFGIDNTEKNIFYTKKNGEICCNVIENIEECRAYRLKSEVNSTDFKNICPLHFCKNNYICLPFSVEGNFSGIVKIMFEEEEKKKTLHNLPYIKAYLNEVSAIIESRYTLELLKKQNIKDPLTGLYNRRYMEEILTKLIASAKRSNKKIGFLMIDMDYFKKVNDTYGHDAGDNILRTLAQVILNTIRESDIAIRFGGEEFLIIVNDINSKKDLKIVAEKIRKNVEKTKFNTGREIIHKTVSIGGALFPDDCEKGWECIKFADLALYKAKNTGRNKVVIYSENLKEEANY